MGFLEEFPLRSSAYVHGLGEFLGNIVRNAQATFSPRDPVQASDLCGKTCIITGGNAGIGFATAQALARRGCKVIIACRSPEKGEKAAKALEAEAKQSQRPKANVEVQQVSLSSLQSVRKFCKEFNSRQEPLDILILNAGIMGNDMERKTTADGFEEHFQVNHLSHWLMARNLLAEQLRRRSQGEKQAASATRVVFLTSFLHMAGRLDLEDLQLERVDYSGFRGYTNSKLLNILAARQLQAFLKRHPNGQEDAAVAVHPGLIQTDLAQGWLTGKDLFHGVLHSATSALMRALSPFILEPASRAAETVLYAATAQAEQVKGQYVAYGRVGKSSKHALDMSTAEKVWRLSMQLVDEQPGLLEAPGHGPVPCNINGSNAK